MLDLVSDIYRHWDRGAASRVDRVRCGNNCRSAVIYIGKLCAVLARRTRLVQLSGQRSHMRLAGSHQLGRNRTSCQAALSAVVADTGVVYDGHVMHVGVVDDGRIHIRYGSVVPEMVVVPIAALVSCAIVAVAVIYSAVKTDVRSPVSAMP